MSNQLHVLTPTSNAINHTVPGPGLFGSYQALKQMEHAAIPCFQQLHREYGNLVRLNLGFKDILISQDIDQVKYVFKQHETNFKKLPQLEQQTQRLFGEGWTEPINRQLIAPYFKPSVYLQLFAEAQAVVQSMLERWNHYAEKQQPFDVAQEMMALSLKLTTHILIRHDFAQQSEAVEAAMMDIIDHWNQRSMSVFKLPEALPTPANRRYLTAVSVVQKAVDDLIVARSQRGSRSVDLLSILQNSTELSTRQVRERLLWIMLPAFEPIGRSLAWMWSFLASHPEVDRQVHTEISGQLTSAPLDIGEVMKLTYCKGVIQETMRLYPPFWLTGREVIHADNIGGYPISAGTMVLINIFGVHHHSSYWDNPDAFDPGRFLAKGTAKTDTHAFIPFSVGPRACLGYQMSIGIMQLVLSMVNRSFQLRLVSKQVIEPAAMMTLFPKHGLWVTATKR